jgi:hypothetical protein
MQKNKTYRGNKGIEQDLTVEQIKLTLKTYQKTTGCTKLSKSTNKFTRAKEHINIEEAGFCKTDFIEFSVADKKQNIESKINNKVVIIDTPKDKLVSALSI